MNKVVKDALVCGAISVVALVAYWDSLGLPPPQYDPLGAGTLPRIVAIAIIVLCCIAVGQTALKHFRSSAAQLRTAPREFVLRPWLAASVFGYALLFAVALALRVPYWVSSVLFLFLTVLTISRFKRSAILPSGIVAIIVGLFVYFLFTLVFHVDLP